MRTMLCIAGFVAAAQVLAIPSDAVQIASGVLTVDSKATKQADVDLVTPGKQVNVGVYHSRLRDARGILVFAKNSAGVPKDRIYHAKDNPDLAEIDYDSLVAHFVDGRIIVLGYKQSAPDASFLPHAWGTPRVPKGNALVQGSMLFPGDFSPVGTGKRVPDAIEIPAGEGNEDRFFNGPYLRRKGYPRTPGFPATLPYAIETSFRVRISSGSGWWEDLGIPTEVYEVATNDRELEQLSSQVDTGGDAAWLARTWVLGQSNELEFRRCYGYFSLEGTVYLFGEATGGMDEFGNAIAPRDAYLVIDWDFANGPINRMIVLDKS